MSSPANSGYCACNVVTYRTEENPPGHIIRGWWACARCGREFISKPAPEQRTFDWTGITKEQILQRHKEHMERLDACTKSAEAGIKRHLEQRRQIPVEDRAGNDLREADEEVKSAEYHEAKRILAKEKQYRP